MEYVSLPTFVSNIETVLKNDRYELTTRLQVKPKDYYRTDMEEIKGFTGALRRFFARLLEFFHKGSFGHRNILRVAIRVEKAVEHWRKQGNVSPQGLHDLKNALDGLNKRLNSVTVQKNIYSKNVLNIVTEAINTFGKILLRLSNPASPSSTTSRTSSTSTEGSDTSTEEIKLAEEAKLTAEEYLKETKRTNESRIHVICKAMYPLNRKIGEGIATEQEIADRNKLDAERKTLENEIINAERDATIAGRALNRVLKRST